MEKEFSPIECQVIMDTLTIIHNQSFISMYQNYKWKHILIVEMISVGTHDIKALDAMNISTSIFAEGPRVKLWMEKY